MSNQAELKETAKNKAAELAQDAQDAIHDEANRRVRTAQDSVAGATQEAADAANAAASQFDPQSFQAQAVRQLADRIDDVARQIRSTDLDTMVRDVSDFARRNPLVFLGAAAALGFATTRFLKSQAPEDGPVDYRMADDPWASDSANGNTTVSATVGGVRHG